MFSSFPSSTGSSRVRQQQQPGSLALLSPLFGECALPLSSGGGGALEHCGTTRPRTTVTHCFIIGDTLVKPRVPDRRVSGKLGGDS